MRAAKTTLSFAMVLLSCTVVIGCETIKPYEKEYLLNPLMDDTGVASLGAPLMSSVAGSFEKLGGAGGATGGTSCPTCGG